MDSKRVLKKALKIAGDVLLYAVVIIALAGVILTIFSKKDADGAVTVFGKQMRYVLTASMEKCEETYDEIKDYDIKDIPMNSMVFIETVPEDETAAKAWYDALEIGDVLTFRFVYVRQETITHRLVGKEPNADGGYTLYLQGDNRSDGSDTTIQKINTADEDSYNYVIGKVVGTNYLFGLFVATLKHPAGLVCLVILPAFAIMFFEIFKVYRLISADRRKKDSEEKKKQQNELDELRRRLAELESAGAKAEAEKADAEQSEKKAD